MSPLNHRKYGRGDGGGGNQRLSIKYASHGQQYSRCYTYRNNRYYRSLFYYRIGSNATVINAESIGDNFRCLHCTTIECSNGGRPIIGNNVSCGASVTIIRNIRIGNNVTIGAGSVVVKDVPDNCVIAGNPAKVIKISIIMKSIFMVMSEDIFLLSHRKEIALECLKSGYKVTLIAKNTGKRDEIESLGLNMVDLPVNPTGMNLWEELRTFRFLYRLYHKESPDIIHHVGLKSILWGSLAAKIGHIKSTVINAVTGLGVTFSGDKLSSVARIILQLIHYSCQNRNVWFICQNHEDENLFVANHIVIPNRVIFIKGAGVDLSSFSYIPESEKKLIKILFVARMVEEKGVVILVEAAEKLRRKYGDSIEFILCGGLSNNPKAISRLWLENHCDGHYIKWLGYRTDIVKLLHDCNIVAFPSYYREGVPKFLLEAAATGRPIITCNSIGCKDVVDEGINGYKIPVKDSVALAEKLSRLIDDKQLRKMMGKASRKKAESEFAIEEVISAHMKLYKACSDRPNI